VIRPAGDKPPWQFLSGRRDTVAFGISVISFIISTFTLYQTRIKAPDIDFIVAPYIKHIVDNQSLNEAFFIPITLINRGAKPGSVLSFELTITHAPSGEQQVYFGQYLTQPNNPAVIGDYFTPITLYGQSSVSHTVCFYPPGQRPGTFFSRSGEYTFQIVPRLANVHSERLLGGLFSFRIGLDPQMLALMQNQPDGEYPFPLAVEYLE
jgi:hypothetical protein